MTISDALGMRRSYYALNKDLPIQENEVKELIEDVTALVPDAFDMKSQRVIVAMGEKQDQLWDAIYDVFEGKVDRAKIDSFKAAAGTILYFYDETVVENMQNLYPAYADNFPVWANHAGGMLQISLWTALREAGIGASIQHYNPVIDEVVAKMFDVPSSWKLIAQMPFGGIVAEPEPKAEEDISKRVFFY
jgi:predicted oxidoreductase (fatty acid repression mutant protein)